MNCAEWNAPREPFQVYGNTYFVGPAGLSALLITGDDGHVLADAGLPESVTAIDARIRALGFKTTDIKLILTSHGHFDHVGGAAALQRYTGATVAASASTAQAMRLGHSTADDPQFESKGPGWNFPTVTSRVKVIKDGETIRVGSVTVKAHTTFGHTPGSTTWSWQSCDAGRCLNIVYGDSLTAISADGFKYSATKGRVDLFRASIAKVGALPCDILITTHPSASGLDGKLEKRTAAGLPPAAAGDPLVDSGSCRAYSDIALRNLDQRVAKEGQEP